MKYTGYCSDCKGTGIYRGFAEQAGVGAVCSSCKGSGAREMEVEEFQQRRLRKDVLTVRWSARLDDRIELMPSVTYEEFLAGKRPLKTKAE